MADGQALRLMAKLRRTFEPIQVHFSLPSFNFNRFLAEVRSCLFKVPAPKIQFISKENLINHTVGSKKGRAR